MKKTSSGLSIGPKLYLFIIVTVLSVSLGTVLLAHRVNADQIDRYYKQVAVESAANFASLMNPDFLARLRTTIESEEFQSLRDKAEEADDEAAIQTYLEEHGLWEEYASTRELLVRYLNNMSALKYLYLVAAGDSNALYDMYLIDDDTTPLYETGYYEPREPEFMGVDIAHTIEPRISRGEWGWLCSAYVPVYDAKGNLVCQVGCDFGMDEMMEERQRSLINSVLTAIVFTAIVLAVAVVFVRKTVIRPLNRLTAEMQKFKPLTGVSYEQAGVADLDIRSHDEIRELYEGIRSMQTDIIDHLNSLDVLQKDKERAEEDIKDRDEKIGQISREAYRDALTGVGSKTAYLKKIDELNQALAEGNTNYALVMVDMNNLKGINDDYGHRMGDLYIKGGCHLICETFKHSPVFRIGGDEFVAVLQGLDFERRKQLVAQLKKSYEDALANSSAEPWLRYSAAVGMADFASDDATVELVFKRADRLMYEDKRRTKGIASEGPRTEES